MSPRSPRLSTADPHKVRSRLRSLIFAGAAKRFTFTGAPSVCSDKRHSGPGRTFTTPPTEPLDGCTTHVLHSTSDPVSTDCPPSVTHPVLIHWSLTLSVLTNRSRKETDSFLRLRLTSRQTLVPLREEEEGRGGKGRTRYVILTLVVSFTCVSSSPAGPPGAPHGFVSFERGTQTSADPTPGT